MANFNEALNITGTAATAISLASTAINCSVALDPGVYSIWYDFTVSNGHAHIQIGTKPSTSLTIATGFPVTAISNPVQFAVPQSGFISVVSASSGNLYYQKVG